MKKNIYMIIFLAVLLCGNAVASDIHIRGSYSQGYLQTSTFNYLIDDSKEGSLQFNELNASFSSIINDKLHVGFGLSSRNLGNQYDNEITLNWAYGDYHYKDYLGLRLGRMKDPMGLFGETREMDMFRTSIILPNTYPEAYRDFLSYLDGAGIYGSVPVPYLGSFQYQINAGTQDGPGNGGAINYINERLRAVNGEVDIPHVVDKNVIVNVKWETPLPGLMLSQTYFNLGTFILPAELQILGSSVTGELHIEDLLVTFSSLKYEYNNFTFISEYMTMDFKNTLITDGGLKLIDSQPVFIESWYFNPSYRFNDWLETGAYYCEFYPTKYERHKEYLKDLCFSVRFDINFNWIFKLEYHWFEGIGYVPQSYNPKKHWETDDYSDEDWSMFAAKVTFNF